MSDHPRGPEWKQAPDLRYYPPDGRHREPQRPRRDLLAGTLWVLALLAVGIGAVIVLFGIINASDGTGQAGVGSTDIIVGAGIIIVGLVLFVLERVARRFR